LIEPGLGSEGGRRGELDMISSWSLLADTGYCAASGEKPSSNRKFLLPDHLDDRTAVISFSNSNSEACGLTAAAVSNLLHV
jgi:hypothetical protein